MKNSKRKFAAKLCESLYLLQYIKEDNNKTLTF